MDHDSLSTLMSEWGYYMPPKHHVHSPGYPGLVVAVRTHPTGAHYDPASMELCLQTHQSTIERVRLTQRGIGRTPRCVCPGDITLCDRFNKRVGFYSFGAILNRVVGPDITIYALASSAPILSLEADDDNTLPEQLRAETERLLARHRARWGGDNVAFAQRLLAIEPLTLYFAALRSIRLNYTRHPELRCQFSHLFEMIQREIRWQRESGCWVEDGPLLMELMAPPGCPQMASPALSAAGLHRR